MQTAGVHSQVNVFPAHTHTHTHTHTHKVCRWDLDKVSTQAELHAHTRRPPHPSHRCLCWRLSAHRLTLTLRQRHIHINKETPLCPLATQANTDTHTHTHKHTHTLSLSKPPLHLPGINVISAPSPLYSPNEGHVLIKPWEWMGLVSLLSRPISSFLPSAIHFFFDLLPCSLTVIMLGLPPSLRFPPLIVSSENVFSIWIFFF